MEKDGNIWELESPDFSKKYGPGEVAHSPLLKDNSLPLPGRHAVALSQADIWPAFFKISLSAFSRLVDQQVQLILSVTQL